MCMKMDRWNGKVAVVTGASSGIGLATAKALVQQGLVVVGLARRKEKMEKDMAEVTLEKGKFHAIKCDVSKEEEIHKAFEWIKENIGKVQILINNAGIVKPGRFTEIDNAVLKNIMDVNFMGTVYCTKEVLKVLQANKLEGHIINMNSILGHTVWRPNDQDLNIYIASKHAITGFSETLVRELIGQNIRITSLSPGIVKTEMTEGVISDVDPIPSLESQDIADTIIHIIGTSPSVQIKELLIAPLSERFF